MTTQTDTEHPHVKSVSLGKSWFGSCGATASGLEVRDMPGRFSQEVFRADRRRAAAETERDVAVAERDLLQGRIAELERENRQLREMLDECDKRLFPVSEYMHRMLSDLAGALEFETLEATLEAAVEFAWEAHDDPPLKPLPGLTLTTAVDAIDRALAAVPDLGQLERQLLEARQLLVSAIASGKAPDA